MSEPTAPVCPECGTPRAADGTPACSCGRLASDAHRETRTTEAAAVEDFDPVRIRPFVKVGDGDGRPAKPGDLPVASDAEGVWAQGETVGVAVDPVEADQEVPSGGADITPGGRRRRRTMMAAGAGALVVGVVTAGFVSGLFSYEGPERDGAVPDDIRAELPDGATASSSNAPSAAASSRTTSSASPSPSGTSASPSASPTGSGATPTDSADPSGLPPGGGQTATAGPAPTGPGAENPILRFGDSGPEVVELQVRLREVGLYSGDPDGDFDGQVENAVRMYQLTRVVLGDESGVYGTSTRASLESETEEP
ncbi:peptidoglycan-binding domain-containing protein [Streptomyces sp. NPDC002643]